MRLHRATGLLSAIILPVGLGLAVQSTVAADQPAGVSIAVPFAPMVIDVENYARDIDPIMQQYCVSCHGEVGPDGEKVLEMGLDLTSFAGMMAGSTYGSVVEPGDPDNSLLLEMVESGDMPEGDDKVPAELIEVLRAWIAQGAPEV